MKKLLRLFVLVLSLSAMLFVTGCTKKYTVTFVDRDNVVSTVEVEEGLTVAEVTPAEYAEHTFNGWYVGETKYDFQTPVTSDLTITAKWDLITYYIVFKDADGKILQEDDIAINQHITAPADPTKASDDDYDYEFNGWDTEFDTATKDLVITAMYVKTIRKFDVKFLDAEGAEITTVSTDKYTTVSSINVTKEEDSMYTYSFKGWYTESGDKFNFATQITENITLHPEFYTTPVFFDTHGKKVSLIGASISTFYAAGSEYNSYYTETNQYYYPMYCSNVNSWEKTWWGVACNNLGCTMDVCEAYSGTTCCGSDNTCGESDYRTSNLGDPDIIFLWIGVNDNVSGYSAEKFEAGYRSMVKKVLKNYPDAYVFLMNFGYSNYHLNMPDNHGQYSEETRLAYNNVIAQIGDDYNLWVIDIASVQNEETWRDYLNDNLHPNSTGMRAIGNYVTKSVNEYFNQGKDVYALSYMIDDDTTLEGETSLYYEGEEVSFPTPVKAGYDFLGWYDNIDLTGTPITSTKGLSEDLILYPYFEKTLKAGEFRVYFETNGGILGMTNREEIRTEFLKDFSAYMTADYNKDAETPKTISYSDIASGEWCFTLAKNEETGQYKLTWDYSGTYPWPQNCLTDFYVSEEYGDKWGWINEYIDACASQNKAYVKAGQKQWTEPCLVETAAFLLGIQIVESSHTTADYADLDTLEESVKFLDYATYSKKVYSQEIELPTPTKEGKVFAGWYLSEDFSGSPVTKVSSGCKVYAKWN